MKGMAALGNSFHTVTVACLLDLWPCSRGIRTDPLETRSVVQEWHVEIGQPEMDPMGQLNLEVPAVLMRQSPRWRQRKPWSLWKEVKSGLGGSDWTVMSESPENREPFEDPGGSSVPTEGKIPRV